MNRLELRTRARELLDDEVTPYLWTDAQLNAYIDEALRQACVRGRLLRRLDTIPVVVAQVEYELPAYFDPWTVERVYLTSQPEAELTAVSTPQLLRDYGTFDLGSGTPCHYRLDGPNYEGVVSLQLFPTPTVADTLNIEYVALPCALANDTATPEISTYYHEKLLDGVLMMAFRKRDSDTYDPNAATTHAAMFSVSFGREYSALEHEQIQTKQHFVVIPE